MLGYGLVERTGPRLRAIDYGVAVNSIPGLPDDFIKGTTQGLEFQGKLYAMPMLAALLDKARAKRIFGTKMRSFIKRADEAGTKNIVIQQFEIAQQITSANLVPIIEPEIDIHCPEKGKAEQLLKAAILEKVNELPDGQFIMLKLTPPEQDDFYAEFVKHPRVLRVVALSGGYSREEANNRLRKNHGVVASFSRALVEGLTAQQSDAEFNAMLDKSIQCIFDASNS